MSGWDLLPRIVGLLAAAAVSGLLVRRFGQNVIVGYLLAGLLLGPTGVGLVRSSDDVAVLSELGVALLLFSVGLEFSFARLRQLGNVATVGGTLQVVVTSAIMFLACRALGISAPAAVALGLGFAMSSTAVVLRELTDRAQLDSTHGRNAIGILLLQDVAVIPILILTDALAHRLNTGALVLEVGLRSLAVIAFVIGAWALARYVLPRLLAGAALSGSRELPVIIAVCVSVGAAWAAHTLGFSPSLGAFAAGIVLAESPFATQMRADLTPLSAVFVTLFFASVGTAARLPLSWSYILTILALAGGVMVLKTTVASVGVLVVQRSLRYALITGFMVSQVGEFTFVVSATAYRSGILSEGLFQAAMAISLVTLIVTPGLIGAAPGLATSFVRQLPRGTRAALHGEKPKTSRRVLVIGFGPAGRAVVRALQAKSIPFLVLEMNPNTVAECRVELPIELGDATQPEVLQHARIGTCIAVVVTTPDPGASRLVVSAAQRLAPGVPILARLRYHQYLADLRAAGADHIVDEEETVGLHLAGEAIEIAASRDRAGANAPATKAI
jgi:monovalent cation:H+ antiporter-2, CPA2 family